MNLTKTKFLKNLLGFSMVTWVSFLLGFIATPISTRLFEPGELAKVGMFGTYTALICSTCYLGLDQAFVRFFPELPGRLTQRGLLSLCLSITLGFCVLASAVMALFWRPLSAQVAGEADFTVFLCLCLYSLCAVVFRFLSLCYRMEKNALYYTVQGVIYALLTKIAYLTVGFRDASGRAAILTLTALMAGFAAVILMVQRKRLDPGFPRQLTRPAMSELTRYALPLVPLSLLSWLNSSVSSLALRQLLGLDATGIYTSALGLASTVNIIQTGFNTYWAPYLLENYRNDEKARFYTVHRLMACLLTLFGLLLTLLQAPVFLLLGSSYRSSVVFFPFLFLSPICYCLGETTGMGIMIAKKSYWTTIIYLFSALLNIILCFLLIPSFGLPGAALASALSAILTLLMRTAVGERFYQSIKTYRYLAYTIGLMLFVSFANLLLTGVTKYALLIGALGLACVLYRSELRILWNTTREILKAGRDFLSRRARAKR